MAPVPVTTATGTSTAATPTGAAPIVAAPAAGPQAGDWDLAWCVGNAPARHETLRLTFEADGSVGSEGARMALAAYPNHWDAKRACFEGRARRDLLGGPGGSRDRLDLEVISAAEMRGTLSLRINHRWVAFPVTARLIAPARSE
jgi:hypothetical protein